MDTPAPPKGYHFDPNGQFQGDVWGQLLDYLKGTRSIGKGVKNLYAGMLGPNGSIMQGATQSAANASEAARATATYDPSMPQEAIAQQDTKHSTEAMLGALAQGREQQNQASMHYGDLRFQGQQNKIGRTADAYGGLAQTNPYAKNAPSIWRNILQWAIQGGSQIGAAAAGK